MRLSNHYLLLILGLALVATLGACCSSRQAAESTPRDTVAEPAPAPQRNYSVVGFTATLEGVETVGQLRIAEDSILWVTVTKLVELGRAMATPDSVWLNAPAFGHSFAGTYPELSRMVGRRITFDMLHEIALADDAEARLARLAAELGVNASVSITSRKRVDRLTFPFRKKK